jgi:hypothetical protein
VLEAVFEVSSPDEEPLLRWADVPASISPNTLVRLAADADAAVVAEFFASLVSYNQIEPADSPAATFAALRQSDLVMAGGLRITDPQGRSIRPSCCCGLETWREWATLLATGESPWLGHDPAPWAERTESFVRIWADGGLSDRPPGGDYIEIERQRFHDDLMHVQEDLAGFLARVREWVTAVGYQDADALVDHIDDAFSIRAPLQIATD